VAEIIPRAVGENSCTSITIDTGSENRLNDKKFSPLQEVLQWPNTLKRKFKTNRNRVPCRAWKTLLQDKEKMERRAI
jgi:hypothetical protein